MGLKELLVLRYWIIAADLHRFITMQGLILAGGVTLAAGHGQMTHPPSRFGTSYGADPGHNGGHLWFNQGCQPGCSKCSDKFSGDTCSESGGTMEPTLNDPKLRTWKNYKT